ncbi:hypothetical protein DVB69_14405 [Sporosarcina sp. BI001-red]|uniref:hypothetical protein n=1 Tax=Sporosarcina sp. BI001-red TaxID=2282866 RepID=UPI000E241677|nr:hypothetical protein [Sporosarcina sp. BI001-red]REB06119.1 hypothetical protein DVB69_14405 [Sporosarcina sp. BI001-red]
MKNIMRNGRAIVFVFLLLVGCQAKHIPTTEQAVRYEQNYELLGDEKDELIKLVNPALFTTVDRSNPQAEAVSVPVVPKTGEELKLKTGRYMITGYPTGNIYVFDAQGKEILREIVGDYAGAGSLTVSIDESYTVRADGGYDSVEVFLSPTSLNTELSAGVWEVGTDIKAGKYTISVDQGYGILQILEKEKDAILYELVGGTIGRTESTVQLKEGQWLRVTDASFITFHPSDT